MGIKPASITGGEKAQKMDFLGSVEGKKAVRKPSAAVFSPQDHWAGSSWFSNRENAPFNRRVAVTASREVSGSGTTPPVPSPTEIPRYYSPPSGLGIAGSRYLRCQQMSPMTMLTSTESHPNSPSIAPPVTVVAVSTGKKFWMK